MSGNSRHLSYSPITIEIRLRVVNLLRQGESVPTVVRLTGVSHTTVYSIKNAIAVRSYLAPVYWNRQRTTDSCDRVLMGALAEVEAKILLAKTPQPRLIEAEARIVKSLLSLRGPHPYGSGL